MKYVYVVITNKSNFPIDVVSFTDIYAAEKYVKQEKDRMTAIEEFKLTTSNNSGFMGTLDGYEVAVIMTHARNQKEWWYGINIYTTTRVGNSITRV